MIEKLLPAALLALTMISCAGPRYGAGVGVRFGPPPPPRYGAVGYAPRSGYIWTDGYWDRGSRDWNWMAGSWRQPPRARATWVPGSWESSRGNYRFRRGHWR